MKAIVIVSSSILFVLFASLTVIPTGSVLAVVDLMDREDLCDVCEIVVDELQLRLDKTAKKREIISTGYGLDPKGNMKAKNRIAFRNSDMRLEEALEDLCVKPMEKYRTNYWNKDLPKFVLRKTDASAKGDDTVAEMFQVDQASGESPTELLMNIREQLLDQFGHMTEDHQELKNACSQLVERFEEDIFDWFRTQQDEQTLKKYLCVMHFRENDVAKCYFADVPESRKFLLEDTKLADELHREDDEDEEDVEERYMTTEERRDRMDTEGKRAKLDKLVMAAPVEDDEDESEEFFRHNRKAENVAKVQRIDPEELKRRQEHLAKYAKTIKALRSAYESMKAIHGETSNEYDQLNHSQIDALLSDNYNNIADETLQILDRYSKSLKEVTQNIANSL